MATFRVWAKTICYSYLDVEADSEDQAIKIAEEADGGDFSPTEDGDWELMYDSVDEI